MLVIFLKNILLIDFSRSHDMNKKVLLCSLLLSLPLVVSAAETIPLWPNGAPNKSTITEPETTNDKGAIFNVTNGRLEANVPKNPNGKAIILIPGGGYGNLAMGTFNQSFIPYFLDQGFTTFVLKYRLPKGDPAIPLSDSLEAVKIVRSLFKKYNLHTVGVMGASAGGHLAAMTSVKCSGDSCPDFSVLIYPNITMMQEESQPKSSCRNNLIGKDRSVKYDVAYSAYKHVDTKTPPAFLAVSAGDEYAGSLGSMLYTRAMVENARPVSLHVYPTGNHGWGIGKSEKFPDGDKFKDDLTAWLKDIK